jgi:hypothetical protein
MSAGLPMSWSSVIAGPSAKAVRASLLKRAALLAAIAAAALLGSVSLAAGSSITHYCGYVAFGKGWYLYTSRNVSCRTGRLVFNEFYKRPACSSATASGSCAGPPYHCHSWFNSLADVGHVRCMADPNRIVKWRSNP